jgi:hypothetical protein
LFLEIAPHRNFFGTTFARQFGVVVCAQLMTREEAQNADLVVTDGSEYSKVVIETRSCALFGVGRPKRSRK